MLEQATLSGEVNKKKSRVKCEICGRELMQITVTHLKTHDITMCEYRNQFPDAFLVSEVLRKKRSDVLLGKPSPMKGKHHTDEAKQKQREAHLGNKVSEETKQKMRDSSPHLSGKDHPMYGVHRYGKDAPGYGKESWKKGLTKETNDIVKKSGEKLSKTMKEFFATEKGQKWLDDNLRGENSPKYGKTGVSMTGEKNGMYGKHHTKEARQKISDNHQDNSGEKHSMYGKHPSDETRQKMSKSRLGEKNPMFDKHLTGEKNGNWQGGISHLPYCEKFDNDLKERVRNFFGRRCYVCGKNEIDNGRKLDVHHVNYDKMVCCNDVRPLFVPLCRSCHTKIQKDREGWEEFFTVSLQYLTDGKCFLPKKVDSLFNGGKEK